MKGSPVRVRASALRHAPATAGVFIFGRVVEQRNLLLGVLLGSLVDPITTLNGRPRVGDQLVRIHAPGAAELRDHMRVRAQRHRRAVPSCSASSTMDSRSSWMRMLAKL